MDTIAVPINCLVCRTKRPLSGREEVFIGGSDLGIRAPCVLGGGVGRSLMELTWCGNSTPEKPSRLHRQASQVRPRQEITQLVLYDMLYV